MAQKSKTKITNQRGSGILLPVFSLPSNYGIGTLGASAFHFIDFLKSAGQKYWQVLPVGPTSFGDSPYQSFSVFAGNPYFIDLDVLIDEGLLTQTMISSYEWGSAPENIDYDEIFSARFQILQIAFQCSKHLQTDAYQQFCRQNEFWLQDYSLYMALKFHFENHEWLLWPDDIRLRSPKAIKKYEKELKEQIDFWKFCQFKFFEQWEKVKKYANENGIRIIGDIPIYAALDSADLWTHGDLFQLDEGRKPIKVAGVPPDCFCATGQLWGNPLYDWDSMEKDGFTWWKRRMEFSAKLYDKIRIDHFIGIVKYYAIPAGEDTAMNGSWCQGPGKKLTDAINSTIGKSKIIAEDLGVAVPEAVQLLKKNSYPGMKVMQFAFDGNPENEHLPCHYSKNIVAYSGTHDNETLAGFFSNLKEKKLKYAKAYLNVKHKKDLPWAVIRTLYESSADTVIVQMQDIIGLSDNARINMPSTVGTNWRWRVAEGQLTEKSAKKLKNLTLIYGR